MLKQLVSLLQQAPGGLSRAEISRELRAQPAAVAGMLELLARQRRLNEIGPGGDYCMTCGLQGQYNRLAVCR
jgi:DNA-binding IclR family transcriptional regulator